MFPKPAQTNCFPDKDFEYPFLKLRISEICPWRPETFVEPNRCFHLTVSSQWNWILQKIKQLFLKQSFFTVHFKVETTWLAGNVAWSVKTEVIGWERASGIICCLNDLNALSIDIECPANAICCCHCKHTKGCYRPISHQKSSDLDMDLEHKTPPAGHHYLWWVQNKDIDLKSKSYFCSWREEHISPTLLLLFSLLFAGINRWQQARVPGILGQQNPT